MWPPVSACQARPSGRLRPSSEEQQVAGHDGRQHQRQHHDALDQRAQRMLPAREQPAEQDARHEARRDRQRGDAHREQHDLPLRFAQHAATLGKREAGVARAARAPPRPAGRRGSAAPRRLRRAAQRRRVVLDRRMARGVEGEETLDRRDPGVGRVDEARLELALLDGVQHRAHVLLADEPRAVAPRQAEAARGPCARTRRPGRPRRRSPRDRPARAASSSASGSRRSARGERASLRRDARPARCARTPPARRRAPLSRRKSIQSGLAERKTSAGAPSWIWRASSLEAPKLAHDAGALEARRERLDHLGQAGRGEDAERSALGARAGGRADQADQRDTERNGARSSELLHHHHFRRLDGRRDAIAFFEPHLLGALAGDHRVDHWRPTRIVTCAMTPPSPHADHGTGQSVRALTRNPFTRLLPRAGRLEPGRPHGAAARRARLRAPAGVPLSSASSAAPSATARIVRRAIQAQPPGRRVEQRRLLGRGRSVVWGRAELRLLPD